MSFSLSVGLVWAVGTIFPQHSSIYGLEEFCEWPAWDPLRHLQLEVPPKVQWNQGHSPNPGMASQRPSPSRTLLPWIGITFIDKYCPGQWTYILHYIHMILLKPTQCLQWNFDHMECQGKSFSKNLWSSMSTCTSPPLASFTSSAGIAPLITEAYEHSLINCIELNRTSTMNSRLPGSLYSLSSPPSIEKPSLHLISRWWRRVAKQLTDE